MYRTGQEVIKERDVLCELEGRNLHGSVVGRIREAENVSDSCKTVTSVGLTRQRRRSFCINLSFENKFGSPTTTRGHLLGFFHLAKKPLHTFCSHSRSFYTGCVLVSTWAVIAYYWYKLLFVCLFVSTTLLLPLLVSNWLGQQSL